MKNIGFELYCHFSFLPSKKLRFLTDVQSILLVYSNTYFSAYKFFEKCMEKHTLHITVQFYSIKSASPFIVCTSFCI